MRKILVVLDSGPLGMLSKAPGRPAAVWANTWIDTLLGKNYRVAIPEIARYEIRRELFRAGLAAGVNRLDHLQGLLDTLPITRTVMDIASELWAEIRKTGRPTAPDEALDGDAILAAQALAVGDEWDQVLIATTNVNHLARFPGVDARRWETIA